MKSAPFKYHALCSIQEVTTLLASRDNTKALAGGQLLVPMIIVRIVAAAEKAFPEFGVHFVEMPLLLKRIVDAVRAAAAYDRLGEIA